LDLVIICFLIFSFAAHFVLKSMSVVADYAVRKDLIFSFAAHFSLKSVSVVADYAVRQDLIFSSGGAFRIEKRIGDEYFFGGTHAVFVIDAFRVALDVDFFLFDRRNFRRRFEFGELLSQRAALALYL
jgi:hypothetical protein